MSCGGSGSRKKEWFEQLIGQVVGVVLVLFFIIYTILIITVRYNPLQEVTEVFMVME